MPRRLRDVGTIESGNRIPTTTPVDRLVGKLISGGGFAGLSDQIRLARRALLIGIMSNGKDNDADRPVSPCAS